MHGLYIHIPFCDQKCSYCDFISGPYTPDLIQRYMRGLSKEAALVESRYGRLPIKTIFVGGGTPTVLPAETVKELGDLIKAHFDLTLLEEFTFEANPESVSIEKAESWRAIGANRVSVGLQTAQDEELRVIGRVHDFQTFLNSWQILESVGFHNRNIDCILGLPGQTEESFKRTLETVLSLKPSHLSFYGLILEPDTPMEREVSRGHLVLPDPELERGFYHDMIERVGREGFCQYEISNFAKPGCECRHNLGYWRSESYCGLGVGAHGFLNEIRYENAESISDYEAFLENGELPRVSEESIDEKEALKEHLMLGLRLNEGLNVSSLETQFGLVFEDDFGHAIKSGIEKNWLWTKDGRAGLTREGLDYCNAVIRSFFDCLD